MKSSAVVWISVVAVVAVGLTLAGCSKSEAPASKSESAAAKTTECR